MNRNSRRTLTVGRWTLVLAVSLAAAVGALLIPGSILARGQAAPVNAAEPEIFGTATVGNTITAGNGDWSSSSPLRFTYRWFQCPPTGGAPNGSDCSRIRNAQKAFYRIRAANLGSTIRALVTASSKSGKTNVLADATEVVAVAKDKPVSLSPPAISGKVAVGATLTAKPGLMTGTRPIDEAYLWRRCNEYGGTCTTITGATGETYSPTKADTGNKLRVRVISTNSAGTSFATSTPTALVTPAAPATAPSNTAEPSISGTTRVGQVLRSTRGTWTGTTPITYTFRWYRCQGRGAADASDCIRITNASDNTYVLRQADAGFRIRSQVTARNDDGQDTATSNPTSIVTAAKPVNTSEPTISGTARVGSVLQANRGQWAGEAPITYSYVWLRCDTKGNNCSEIPGADDPSYEVRDADAGKSLRVRVIARNDRGTTSAISAFRLVVGSTQPPPTPPSGSVPVSDLRAGGDRLVVATVAFSPSPVTSRTLPITVRVRVTARGSRPVSGAAVFMRATPRVVEGQTSRTGADGWVTLTLVPNNAFPQPRSGFNVQFFVKAFRPGDPGLGGIAGYRLVQVPLAG